MSEKRLTYVILMNNYYQIREVDDEGCCRRLSPTGIIDLLNELSDENKKLKEENEQLRKKLEQIYSFKGLNCRGVNGV